jgi:hypothetical protein
MLNDPPDLTFLVILGPPTTRLLLVLVHIETLISTLWDCHGCVFGGGLSAMQKQRRCITGAKNYGTTNNLMERSS